MLHLLLPLGYGAEEVIKNSGPNGNLAKCSWQV